MNHKETILIVDDEPIIRDILEGLLIIEGYNLAFAANGIEALKKLDTLTPDLILLDVMMPTMDGFEVCQRIKAIQRLRPIPIILVTALDTKADVVRGLDTGADDFIQKPFDHVELLARVRSMLRIKNQYDQLQKQKQELETALHLNKKFAQVIAHHLEELEILHDAGLKLMTNLDTDSVLNLISQAALELVPEATHCMMHLISDGAQQLLPVVFSPKTHSKIIYPSVGIEAVIEEVIRNRDAIRIPDVSTAPYYLHPRLDEIRTLLAVPLTDDEHVIGTLSIFSPEIDAFEEAHRHILSILANQAVTAILKARFFEHKVKTKEREKRAIRQIFQRYVSPTVVDRLVEGHQSIVLGGKRQEISVLFADIRNFTSFSEKLPSEQVVEILNRYFAIAVEAILAEEGTLDKFMGDAIMALFNAPLAQANDTLKAVRAAMAIQQAINKYNSKTNHEPLNFGIGIHTGQAVVGNIGAAQQMNYTAIGDTVNLAKRIQENAAEGQILLSRAAYQAVKPAVVAESLGQFEFKGRLAEEQIYLLKGCR